jgi:hypothetical protein
MFAHILHFGRLQPHFPRNLGEMADYYNSSHLGVFTCVTSEARSVKVSRPHRGSFLDICANVFGIKTIP